jgi:hypothetical protein
MGLSPTKMATQVGSIADLAALRYTAYMKDAIEQTGAVLMGTEGRTSMI